MIHAIFIATVSLGIGAGATGLEAPRLETAAVALQQQGNKPAQAQQNRQGQGRDKPNRPAQAQQQNRGNQGQGQANRPAQAQQQNRGNQGQGQANRPAQAGPRDNDARALPPGQARRLEARGSNGAERRWVGGVIPAEQLAARVSSLPPGLQRFAGSQRRSERMVAGAAVRGAAWGMDANGVNARTQDDHVVVTNRRGDVLVQLTERRARELGSWQLRRLGDRRPNGNAPAFCRSGAGHPVWGREWCLDKGFGLGSLDGRIWSRTRVDDVVFRRTDRDRLTRDVLIDVVGDVVFNRLALHALSLGYSEPLRGSWVVEPDAPRILHVHAGDVVIAELVDLNRNDRVDVLYVIQPL